MEDTEGKEILKKIIVDPRLDREYIINDLSKNIKSNAEKLEEIELNKRKIEKTKIQPLIKLKKIATPQQKLLHKKSQSFKEQQLKIC